MCVFFVVVISQCFPTFHVANGIAVFFLFFPFTSFATKGAHILLVSDWYVLLTGVSFTLIIPTIKMLHVYGLVSDLGFACEDYS